MSANVDCMYSSAPNQGAHRLGIASVIMQDPATRNALAQQDSKKYPFELLYSAQCEEADAYPDERFADDASMLAYLGVDSTESIGKDRQSEQSEATEAKVRLFNFENNLL